MNKALIAVDDTRSSKAVLSTYLNLVRPPREMVLLHVERLEGRSMMIDMLGEAEMETLRESVRGTEHKESLDRRAGRVLSFYEKGLREAGALKIKKVVREGRPAEEILKVAREEGAGMIILGPSRSKGLGRLVTGSVAAEVQKAAGVPVLTAKRALVCEEPYTWRDAFDAMKVFTAVFLVLFLLGVIIQQGHVNF